MKFRLKAFGVHLLCSSAVLSLILGGLYLGWYHWPGWYLTDVIHVIAVMVAVDVVLGPLITLIIANERKPRRELARDIVMIVAVQLSALGYGTTALWNGRPLYYAFSVNCLQVVQAYDIDGDSARTARKQGLELAPHWYSLPRWIWAPFPKDSAKAGKIFQSLMQGGYDIIGLPQYYQTWPRGVPELRTQLQKVSDIRFFSPQQKAVLEQRMQAAKLDVSQRNGIALTGRGSSLLAVMDPRNLQLLAIIKAT
ncbi:MAG TPA: hypothetical protein VHY75_10245 [Steroidobacteraceae bacterium]|jgi:hypothetical protein|nr:hypothetical protein [Steroidobacteraceae bacterium]